MSIELVEELPNKYFIACPLDFDKNMKFKVFNFKFKIFNFKSESNEFHILFKKSCDLDKQNLIVVPKYLDSEYDAIIFAYKNLIISNIFNIKTFIEIFILNEMKDFVTIKPKKIINDLKKVYDSSYYQGTGEEDSRFKRMICNFQKKFFPTTFGMTGPDRLGLDNYANRIEEVLERLDEK